MVAREILLGVAAFLDSGPAQRLSAGAGALGREDLRSIASSILGACYEDLGCEPRELDGQGVEALLTRCLPGRFARKDPLAEHLPAVLDAFVEHLDESEVLAHAFELRNGVAAHVDGFVSCVREGRNEPRASGRLAKPVVHQADKLGRNDPCFCGSGKKFKKCHGRAS